MLEDEDDVIQEAYARPIRSHEKSPVRDPDSLDYLG